MRLPVPLLTLLTLLTASTTARDVAPATLTLYAWPLSASTPTPLAKVTNLDTSSSNPPTIASYTPPSSISPDDLVRVGLYDPSTKEWRGVVTAAASFDPGYRKRVTLHVDREGRVFHVGFGAAGKREEGKGRDGGQGDEEVEVEVVGMSAGPLPALNKPVVLSAEGKVEEKADEKTFLQKYWWVIGLFLLMQVLAGGGGDK